MSYSIRRCQRPVDRDQVVSELKYSGATEEEADTLVAEAANNPGRVVTYNGLLDVYGVPYAFFFDLEQFNDNLCTVGDEIDRDVSRIAQSGEQS